MRRDSAGVVDPTLNETQVAELEAEELAALDALWRSESERTDIMQPQHMGALLPGSREVDPDETARLPDPEAVASEDPGWDDDRELTEALDFDRLAPWQAAEPEPIPDWTLELTTTYDRPAHDIGELDWDEAAELTHRMDSPPPAAKAPKAARGLEFRRDEASTARGLPSGLKEHAADKRRAGSRDSVPSPRESTVQPRSRKRVGRETLPARGNRPKPSPARATLRSGWPLSAALEHEHLLPATHALRGSPQPLAASVRAARVNPPAAEGVLPIVASAATTSRRPALRTAARQPAGGERVTRSSFREPHPEQPPAAKSGPRPALRAALPFESLAPAELERPAESRRIRSSLWWAAGGFAFVGVCVAVRLVASGTAEPAQVAVAVETPVTRSVETALSLTSHPTGAQIFVDGNDTGLITPSRVRDLSPGLHAVELKLAGHYATGLPATLGQGETLELPAIELRPLPTAVELPMLVPADAPAPPRRQSARRSARRQPTASSLSAAELAVAREPEPAADGGGSGMLQINSRPWARILVDGEFVGNTPQLRLRLSAGTHTVRLVNEPLRMSKTLTLTIRDGETLTKIETLSEDAAQSRVAIQGNEALAVR